ncbi:hypothetical protein [Botrimarina sp.]|uniref:hypothetical protein n=1 Tax=Botrimarina sp. TaxID=2795802 RepID=UPI0032EC2BCB
MSNTFASSLPGALRILLVVLAATPGAALATTIYDSGSLGMITGPSDDIEVRDSAGGSPTFVIADGAQIGFQLNPDNTLALDPETNEPISSNTAQSIAVFDTSIVAMQGGETADSVVVSDESRFALISGDIGDDILASDNASVTIAGGALDDLVAGGSALVAMSGGSADTVELSGSARFVFSGGRVDDIDTAGGSSRVFVGPGALIDDDAFFVESARLETTGGQFDDELQFYDNTTAYFNGGNVGDDLVAAGSSVIEIHDLTVDDTIEAEGSSRTTIFGGQFGAIEAAESAVVEFYGGTVLEGVAGLLGGKVVVDGGELAPVDGPEVLANLNGTVDVFDTPGTVLNAEASSGGAVNVFGGDFEELTVDALAAGAVLDGADADELAVFAELGATVEIRGGQILDADLEARSGSTITLFGTEFFAFGQLLDFGPVPFVAGDLVGTLADGGSFSGVFRRDFGLGNAAQIVLVNLPEPTSALMTLAAALAAALRPSRRGRTAPAV